ncbi:MAG: hypothetical protein VBE63_31115 [Lamprobacter sp.]|uniref:hypothetical protein n=1 Tax=Lamprobacter sp. TaxID=3100796 RepID=UPI002B25B56F|nr:hypothetical protein [Lamprobacter sp.]MEA3644342.1 hypothetical protein [Lamprobacter sp.]
MNITPDRDHPMTLPETHAKLLAELERFKHLLFEPMTQVDLGRYQGRTTLTIAVTKPLTP